MIIERIKVMKDGTAEIRLIDSTVERYRFPKYKPSLGFNYTKKTHIPGKARKMRCSRPKKKRDEGVTLTECRNCGVPLTQIPKHKKKKFCCDKCRNDWWNSHQDEVDRRAIYHYTCPTCGEDFDVYGNGHRKYCSHECYIKGRFGTTENL